jgi:hypothetical protein
MFLLPFLFSIVYCLEPGMQRAVNYMRLPFPPVPQIRDIILAGKVDDLRENAYKLNNLRTRLGKAWEMVFTDFGFNMVNNGFVDLMNVNRSIAIELKNSWDTDNSKSKHYVVSKLEQFKANNPQYTVIYGAINYKNAEGRDFLRNNIRFMYGNMFLDFIFAAQKNQVIIDFRSYSP